MVAERAHEQQDHAEKQLQTDCFLDIIKSQIRRIVIKSHLLEDGILYDAKELNEQKRPKFDIWIAEDLGSDERLLTLVHEIVHVDRSILNGVIRERNYDPLKDPVEQSIVKEAKRFLKTNKDLVKAEFERLIKV